MFYTFPPLMNLIFMILVLMPRIFRFLHIPVPGMLEFRMSASTHAIGLLHSTFPFIIIIHEKVIKSGSP